MIKVWKMPDASVLGEEFVNAIDLICELDLKYPILKMLLLDEDRLAMIKYVQTI